jgi:Tfp pilus assembly protein PilP
MSRVGPVLALGAVLALAGCTEAPPTAPAAKPPSGTVSAAAAAVLAAPETPQAPAPPSYGSRGRRDPFETLEVRQGAGPSVASAKLTGIVRGARGPMALVETSDGLGYILKPGDTLGDGRLVEIGQGRVVFTVMPRPGSDPDRVVLNLVAD